MTNALAYKPSRIASDKVKKKFFLTDLKFFVHVHNLNETTVSDGVATYARSADAESLHISGRELYNARYSADACGRLEAVQVPIS